MKVTEIAPKPKENKKLRVAAYARVSSDKDAAFHSLEAQRDYYEKYVATHPDWELVAIYSDNGISGTIVERPAFQEMLQACRDRKVDLIVTKSVTRFARNTVVLLETIRELKFLNIDCYFEKERMHSISSDGELFLTLLAMYAEEEARSASENQRWRIQKKYEQGIPINGKVYGYKLKDGRYTIIPEEAETVKRIYELYLGGYGLTKIAKTLNEEDIPGANGKKWAVIGVRGILTNEKYVGDLLLQKTFIEDFRTKKLKKNNGERRQYFVENDHEPIVNRDLFDAVQKEMERRKHKYDYGQYHNVKHHLFCGLVRCGKCGRLYHHALNNGRSIWVCPSFRTYGKDICQSGYILEDILIEKTKAVLSVDSLDVSILKDMIIEIAVPEHKTLIFHLSDGTTKNVQWNHRSRKYSWTDEMKEAARQRSKEQWKKRKEESK